MWRALLILAACSGEPATLATRAQVGRAIFLDPNMSEPAGQACADCHAATAAFRDPESERATSMGVIPGRFGTRNAGTAMYTAFVPALHYDATEQQLAGGLFWDGRADSLEAQAAGPLLNPLEMNNPSRASVVAKLRDADYAPAFRALYGANSLDDDDQAFANLTAAVAEFERSPALAPFSSKYDRFRAGAATLTGEELSGLAIFEDPARGNCASCHPSPMFTNHTYANLGLPPARNVARTHGLDHGLMATTGDAAQDGKFRVPTLRNIGRTAPYGHNGTFANLEYFIDFLNTRDVGSQSVGTCSRARGSVVACAWPAPEVAANVDTHVGHLDLSQREVEDLVAFLMTLTDETPSPDRAEPERGFAARGTAE